MDKTYNVVYLNSSHYKLQLAKYLLQSRYTDFTGKVIQECCAILRTKENNMLNYNCDISVVWSYDGYAGKTHFIIYTNKQKEIQDEFIKLPECDVVGDCLSMSMDGIHDSIKNYVFHKHSPPRVKHILDDIDYIY